MRIIATILFTLLVTGLHAQKKYWVTEQTAIDGRAAWVSLPASYNDSVPKRYPLILFMPGNGEVGFDYNTLKDYGPHKMIVDNGMRGVVDAVTGDTIECIVISVQPNQAWFPQASHRRVMDTLYYGNRFRIDTFRVSKTGLSGGAWSHANYVTANNTHPNQKFRIASMVLMHQPLTDNYTNDATKHGNMATYVRNGGWIWGFEDTIADARKMNITRDSCNNAVPGSYRYTGRPTVNQGHGGWNTWYSPSYTENIGGVTMNVYQWMLSKKRPGAYQYWESPTPPEGVALNPIADFSRVYSYATNPPFSITATVNQGSVTSWSWMQTGGPASLTLSNTTTATVTASNITVAGYYTFQVIGTGAAGSDTKTVTVQIRDLMQKNVNPCRVGGGKTFYLGNSLISGIVTAAQVYARNITTNNTFGETPLGGDTIRIVKNPNNDGVWQLVDIGDFGGGPGCPIVVMSDSVTTIGATNGAFRIATGDSNVVAYVKIDGLANRLTKGEVYGFRYDRRGYSPESNSIGFNANLVHHFELNGFVVRNAGVGVMIKKNSDSSNPYSIYDNFQLNNVNINNGFLEEIQGEGMYIGHTDIAGTSQAGNNGRTITGDSLTISRIIINKTEWDGLQVSNFGNGADINNIVAYRTGTINQSSQQWSIFIGGNTSGKIYNSVAYNGTGPMGTLGKGIVDIYNNYVDSVNNGLANADGIYVSMSTSGMLTPVDSLQANVYNNIIGSNTRHSVFYANSSGAMKGGRIENNITTKSGGTFSSSVTAGGGAVISGNTVNTSLDKNSALAARPEYQIFNMLRNQPAGTLISFFDLQLPGAGTPKPVGIKRGHRQKVKRN